ncbi:putative ABC transporter permease protein [Candidatus Promineifilum breve]|uniref:ABC transporter permease protein n=1 Tax=Candidatus Promineifilum breve TaxID=1806508 RepID=A0A170PI57_9CHLR|nr:FtsX-like permease family protein [Candidatus Promineifilum breve]CUS04653.2 putative ABC transporter permease protein [Candidatus Promineifilum breve]
MNIQLTLAARYLRGRKLRTTLTTLAILFGVLVIVGMNSLLPAFTRAFQTNVLAAAGQVDATITLKTSDAFDAAKVDRVAAVEGVRVVSGLLNRTVNLPADYLDDDPARPDATGALSLVGIDVAQATALHAYNVQDGRFLADGDADVAVISQSLAELIGLGVGDTLTLPTPTGQTALTIAGILPPRMQLGNEEVFVTLAQAQAMLDMPGLINTIEANFDVVDEDERLALEQAILTELGDTFQLGGLSSNAELLANMDVAQAIFSLLGVLAVLMGGFIIFNTFRTIVAERRRDIGMLRALGAGRRTILGTFLAEGLIQGVIGTVLGILAGYGLGLLGVAALQPILSDMMNVDIGAPVVSPGLLIGSAVIGIGVTLLAGLLPAMSAGRVTPLEALRPSVGAVSLRRLMGVGFWAGVVMIALAVAALLTRDIAFIGLGAVLFVIGLILVGPALVNPVARFFSGLLAAVFARSGTAQLAQGNLTRQPSRAAITASTMLIGMSILILAASVVTSVTAGFGEVMRRSLGSDFILIPPSIAAWGTNVGAGSELADALREVEGVEVVSSLRFAPTQANGAAVSLLGIDPVTYSQVSGLTFSEGDESAYAALAEGRTAILSPAAAVALGAAIGDEVELMTPTGPQLYRVVGVGGDYLNAKITTVYISHDNIAADFNRTEDVLIQANLAAGADRVAAEAGMKDALRDFPQFRLIAGQEYIDENLALFDSVFTALYVLVLFLAVPSVIAMVNTLAIGVIERTREIGMLRAVGSTRGQVRRVVLAEALILAALGTLFGILAGLYLGYMGVAALEAFGYPMTYIFPTMGVIIALVAGIVFGVLAAIIPARQASRLEIVQALRYE